MIARRAFLAVAALACLGAAQPPQGNATAGTRYLYLIRHGIYDRDEKADDRTGNGINAVGREQAKLTAARLAKLPVRFAHLYTSDFTRARDTAGILQSPLKLAPEVDPLLHETTPKSERTDLEADASADADLAAAWTRYVRPLTTPGDEHDVLVSHGNVIRWFVARTLGADPTHWTRMDIANCSLTVIAVRPDGTARLVLFSDASHIPIAKQTWAGSGAGWSKR
jgi:serine/threonine-protein phosphatase PGAM5